MADVIASTCPFCTLPCERILFENASGVVIRDGFPVSPGHTRIILRRHIASFFDMNFIERENILALLDKAKDDVDKHFKPDAYNIGINDGLAAGQTVQHLHIHLIPRYNIDHADPRGGVRWVLPAKADYWS